VTERWGGDFYIRHNVSWRSAIREWKEEGGKICHLSMYGINLPDAIGPMRLPEKLMIVVGAEKVPFEIYGLADWNVAVGNQPHSEVAAVAVTLDRLSDGDDPLRERFEGAKLEVVPEECGKRVIENPD
jgi:tRNA (cytidine56-2'-O)-methyltransferase